MTPDDIKYWLNQSPEAKAELHADGVPVNVRAALGRMCKPLHESRLSGVTAEEDARCMALIRDYALAPRDAEPKTDAQIDAAIIAWFEYSANAADDYRARMRAAIAAAGAPQTNKDDPQ